MHRDLQFKEIETIEFSPVVLHCSLFNEGMTNSQAFKFGQRYVYDYEIEYFLESKGSMEIEGVEYKTNKGDLVFRRPGQLVQGIMPYSCYLICFDITGKSDKTAEDYVFGKEQLLQPYYSNAMLDSLPSVFHPNSPEKYHHIFDSVLKEFINYNEYSSVILKSLLLQIIYEFHKDVKNPLNNVKLPSVAQYKMLEKVVEYVQNNIGNKLCLSELSDITHWSPNYFHKIFTEAMGITPNEFVTKAKIDRSKDLLVRTDKAVTEIAIQCGFENTPYFSYLFKKQVNLTPGEFRNRYKYY